MKFLWRMGGIFFMVWCILGSVSEAGMLSEDYELLVQKRYDLEVQRQTYEKRLTTLSAQKKSLTLLFLQCISQKDKAFWEEKLSEANASNDELEASRLEIADLRKHLDQIRQKMEKHRIEIENKHTAKGPGTPYESAFREYMKALNDEYFVALEEELFGGYNTYLAQVEKHIIFLKEHVGICMKRKVN